MSDPIADMLTRIRNAGKAKHNSVDIPGSKIKTEIAKVLKESGYIRNYKFMSDGKQGVLRVYLKYTGAQKHTIVSIERISKPSRRRAASIRSLIATTFISGWDRAARKATRPIRPKPLIAILMLIFPPVFAYSDVIVV